MIFKQKFSRNTERKEIWGSKGLEKLTVSRSQTIENKIENAFN